MGKKGVLSKGPIPILVGEDISRYFVGQPSRFLQILKKEATLYQAPKIVMLKTGYKCIAGLDTIGYATMQSVYNVHLTTQIIAYEVLLALLNSRFVYCYIYKNFTSYKDLFPQLNHRQFRFPHISQCCKKKWFLSFKKYNLLTKN